MHLRRAGAAGHILQGLSPSRTAAQLCVWLAHRCDLNDKLFKSVPTIVTALMAPSTKPTLKLLSPVSDLIIERGPERVTIKSGRDQKKDDPQVPDSFIGKRYADVRSSQASFSFGSKCFSRPVAFCRSQPTRCFGTILQIEKDAGGQDNRRQRLQEEQPLPAR